MTKGKRNKRNASSLFLSLYKDGNNEDADDKKEEEEDAADD